MEFLNFFKRLVTLVETVVFKN